MMSGFGEAKSTEKTMFIKIDDVVLNVKDLSFAKSCADEQGNVATTLYLRSGGQVTLKRPLDYIHQKLKGGFTLDL